MDENPIQPLEQTQVQIPEPVKPHFKFPIILLVVVGLAIAGYFASAYYFSLWPFKVSIAPMEQTKIKEENNSTTVPSFIIEKSDQFVISRIGSDFFNKYVFLKGSSTKYYEAINCNSCSDYLRRPHYMIVYTLKNPSEPSATGIIEFAVDVNGNIIVEREPSGIPNCITDPIECEFISKEQAMKVAKDAGLEAGIKEWKAQFTWNIKYKTYLWGVQNTMHEDEDGSGGRSVVIDANTGSVIEINGWSAIYDHF